MTASLIYLAVSILLSSYLTYDLIRKGGFDHSGGKYLIEVSVCWMVIVFIWPYVFAINILDTLFKEK